MRRLPDNVALRYLKRIISSMQAGVAGIVDPAPFPYTFTAWM
jgi:hypothetical protein